MKVDPAVQEFAKTMQYKLNKNEHKECPNMNPDGEGRKWDKCSLEWLFNRMVEESTELLEAIQEGDWQNAMLECADVGNFAMMIQENIHRKTTIGR